MNVIILILQQLMSCLNLTRPYNPRTHWILRRGILAGGDLEREYRVVSWGKGFGVKPRLAMISWNLMRRKEKLDDSLRILIFMSNKKKSYDFLLPQFFSQKFPKIVSLSSLTLTSFCSSLMVTVKSKNKKYIRSETICITSI